MTPTERFERYAAQIERANPGLNAFLHLRLKAAADEVAASARRFAADAPLSPMDGWCVAVKANIAVEGLPYHAGIAAYRDEIAAGDAEVVARLKAAGAVILGVVNMHEGALGATTDNEAFGRTQNPWAEGVTPGGSSGGSAAAVAAGLCDAALGSDTMGSVRIPSAYCGVQGHKPTTGWVSNEGVLALSPTLDHVGPHARSVGELAATLAVMSGRSVASAPIDLSGPTFGVWRGGGEVELTPAVSEGFEAALATLEAAGARLTDVEPPAYRYGASRRAGLLISEIEAAAIHAERLKADPAGFSKTFRRLMAWGAARPPEEVEAAYAHVREVRAAAPVLFETVDFVLAPTAPQEAFPFDTPAPADQADFTAWADFAALPATALYTGLTPAGLPLSLQVMGPEGADAAVLSAAMALEQVFGPPPAPPGSI